LFFFRLFGHGQSSDCRTEKGQFITQCMERYAAPMRCWKYG
jgi:hypothetical protein